jgi:DNA-directed RNA polymerase specialized sigma24 family protein
MNLGELYRVEVRFVRSCLRKFGARREETLDLAHEVFLRLLWGLPRFRGSRREVVAAEARRSKKPKDSRDLQSS